MVPKRPFPGNDVFNANVARWDTAAATDMNDMFCQATAFNQPLDSWDTAAVTDMNWMFACAKAFNQHLPWWNTAAATNMDSMFRFATAFNQNVDAWSTGAVEGMDVPPWVSQMGDSTPEVASPWAALPNGMGRSSPGP